MRKTSFPGRIICAVLFVALFVALSILARGVVHAEEPRSEEDWQEQCRDVRTSFNPSASLSTTDLTITQGDERFKDFLFWAWHNGIDEHRVEAPNGVLREGPNDDVTFLLAPGTRWEMRVSVRFDRAINHVAARFQWQDVQFPEFFEKFGGAEDVIVEERVSANTPPTWDEFLGYIGNPEGRHWDSVFQQAPRPDREHEQIVILNPDGGIATTYRYDRYLTELAYVLTDCKTHEFFQLYDERGKGFTEAEGWTQYYTPRPVVEEEEDGAVAVPSEVVVKIKDFSFGPKEIKVVAGSIVTWTNEDPVAHTATQEGGGPSFNSGLLNKGQSYSFTFAKPGVYHYYCIPHPFMKGTITVTDGGSSEPLPPLPPSPPATPEKDKPSGELGMVAVGIIATIVGIGFFAAIAFFAWIMAGGGRSYRG